MPHEVDARRVRIESLDPRMVEALRGMTERRRLDIAWGMWRSARNMIENLQRAEHPEWTQQEVVIAARRRLLGQSR